MAHPIMFDPDDPTLEQVRMRALALPGAVEKVTFGRPWFKAGKLFAMYGGGTKGPDGEQHEQSVLVHIDPEELPARMQDLRFFVPSYVGPFGWLGIDVGGADTDWTEIEELLDASYRLAAPRTLVRELDARARD